MEGRLIAAYILAGMVIVALVVIPLRACAVVAGALGPERVPSDAEFDQLEAQGDAIIVEIEAYRQIHGEYPATLEDAAIVVPRADYGGWKYERTENGGFVLRIGQYTMRSPFTLFRRSGDDEWHIDG